MSFSQIKTRLFDTIARRIIIFSGIVVIISVVAIFLLILRIALPLFSAGSTNLLHEFALPAASEQTKVQAIGLDKYGERLFVILADARLRFLTNSGELQSEAKLSESGLAVQQVSTYGNDQYRVLFSDGSRKLFQIGFAEVFDQQGERTSQGRLRELAHQAVWDMPTGVFEVSGVARFDNEEGRYTEVAVLSDGRLIGMAVEQRENLFGEIERTEQNLEFALNAPAKRVAMSANGHRLYVLCTDGSLEFWDLSDLEEGAERSAVQHRAAANTGNLPLQQKEIRAMSLLLGDESLVIARADGQVEVVRPTRSLQDTAEYSLQTIRQLPNAGGVPTAILPSLRNKSFLVRLENGELYFAHSTSAQRLNQMKGQSIGRFSLNPAGNRLLTLSPQGMLRIWMLDYPHPEFSLAAVFNQVWYEGYDQPDLIWQSSSGSNDFEPKFSLVPLIFGSLKGTFYAMLFAVPLALLGAVYLSQFTTPNFRAVIKPGVEIMSSIPTVVVGFLAALWLAPLVQSFFVALLLFPLLILPVAGGVYKLTQRIVPQRFRKAGYEFLYAIPALVLAAVLSAQLSPSIEAAVFGGDFQQWLFSVLNVTYDQRNSVIIAFALGYAVLPIVFTISDDALSSVPKELSAASLALGANKWQTVWRVVLPTASPGIFSALIIGLGRAVGETMIVLMATGNTPVLDMSIFNGMRTLAANIAVETPEAPVGSTLYRILFLSAIVLFLFTFVLNTIAEVIRQRLRKKYGY